MRTFIQKGEAITIAAPSGGVSSGDPVLIESLFGIASTDAAEGNDIAIATVGVFTLSKVSTDAFTVGAVAYFDAGTGLVTTDDDTGNNPAIGHAVGSAGNPSSTVRVRLSI